MISQSLLTPLRQCRGKSGGMNHAVDILDAYFVRHSKLVQMLVWFKRNDVYTKTPRMFFAIFDCRHMGTQGFWDAVVPYFFRYVSHDNPWKRELTINERVAFVQLPQTFAGLNVEEDFFDMRNEVQRATLARSRPASLASRVLPTVRLPHRQHRALGRRRRHRNARRVRHARTHSRAVRLR